MKKISFLLVFIFVNFNAISQTKKQDTLHHQKDNRFNYKALIIPASLIGYGALSLYSDKLTTLDISIRNSINSDNEKTFPIDEGTQTLAFLSVYGLNLFGVKGKNNLKTVALFGNCLPYNGVQCYCIKKSHASPKTKHNRLHLISLWAYSNSIYGG